MAQQLEKQFITRKCTFDAGHRVMNERMKCFNLHGHTYHCELTFAFDTMERIGYAIDFKELKRVACQWIDDLLDHGMILNPHDEIAIKATQDLGGKLWLMSLNGQGKYCNPSVENIAREIVLAMEVLFANYPSLSVHKVVLWETPNCSTECFTKSINDGQRINWLIANRESVERYREEKGVIEYDDTKLQNND